MIVKFAEIKQPVIGVMSSFTRVHLAPLNSSTINWPIKACMVYIMHTAFDQPTDFALFNESSLSWDHLSPFAEDASVHIL